VFENQQTRQVREAVVKQVPFADDVLYRFYLSKDEPPVTVYACHSHKGEDRNHHPEIWMREASGMPEDPTASARIPLDASGARLAQRFRFRTGTGSYTLVYNWHYTFPSEANKGETFLQSVHRRLAVSPPSITIQVSATGGAEIIEREFLPALDTLMQQQVLPPGSEVGCDRIPITMVRR
jgi:hypothetical protein